MLGLFIFAISASYSLCTTFEDDLQCWDEVDACYDSGYSPDFPDTTDQLKEFCREEILVQECIVKVVENCEALANFTKSFRQDMEKMRDVCRQDNKIFQDVSSNIECIGSALRKSNTFSGCYYLYSDELVKYRLKNIKYQYTEETQLEFNGEDYNCLDSVFHATCESMRTVMRCGVDAGAALKEFLNKMYYSSDCTEEFLTVVIPKVEDIEWAWLFEGHEVVDESSLRESYGATYGRDTPVKCYKKLRDECSHHKIPSEFPDSVSKLQETCRAGTNFLVCTLKVREECDPDGNATKFARELKEYIQSICDEDSLTYKVFSKNIHCISSVQKHGRNKCESALDEEDSRQIFRNIVESQLGNLDSIGEKDLQCLHDHLLLSCRSLLAGIACGDEVEDVITDVNDKVTEFMSTCRPGMSAVKETLRLLLWDALKADEKFTNAIAPDGREY